MAEHLSTPAVCACGRLPAGAACPFPADSGNGQALRESGFARCASICRQRVAHQQPDWAPLRGRAGWVFQSGNAYEHLLHGKAVRRRYDSDRSETVSGQHGLSSPSPEVGCDRRSKMNLPWPYSDLPIDAPERRRLPLLLRRAWYGLNQAFRRRIAHLDITPDQFTVMRTLLENEGITQRELTRLMSSDPNTITSILDRMEKAGLVQRQSHERD